MGQGYWETAVLCVLELCMCSVRWLHRQYLILCSVRNISFEDLKDDVRRFCCNSRLFDSICATVRANATYLPTECLHILDSGTCQLKNTHI